MSTLIAGLRLTIKALTLFLASLSVLRAFKVLRDALRAKKALSVFYSGTEEFDERPRGWFLRAWEGSLTLQAWFTLAGSRVTAGIQVRPAPVPMPDDYPYDWEADAAEQWKRI